VFELGPRFILLALGLAFLQPWLYIGVGVHFVLALAMHIVINPTLEGVCPSWMKIPFLILISFINIFCFINLEKGQTRRRVMAYYILYYVENVVIMVIILTLSPDITCNCCSASQMWRYVSFSLLPGALLHFLFQCIYYSACHPHLQAEKSGH